MSFEKVFIKLDMREVCLLCASLRSSMGAI